MDWLLNYLIKYTILMLWAFSPIEPLYHMDRLVTSLNHTPYHFLRTCRWLFVYDTHVMIPYFCKTHGSRKKKNW